MARPWPAVMMMACRHSTGCATDARMGPCSCLPSISRARWCGSAPGAVEVRKATLASLLRRVGAGVQFNEHLEHEDGGVVFRHACKMGLEGIVSKRLGSVYRSGRSRDWLKMKNPAAPAVKREAEEDWGKERWR